MRVGNIVQKWIILLVGERLQARNTRARGVGGSGKPGARTRRGPTRCSRTSQPASRCSTHAGWVEARVVGAALRSRLGAAPPTQGGWRLVLTQSEDVLNWSFSADG